MRRRQLEERRSGTQAKAHGRRQLQARSVCGEIRLPERGRGAVDVGELRELLRKRCVEVPPAAAEEARLQVAVAEPLRLGAHGRGRVDADRRSRLLRAAPVRVVTERRQ